MKIYERVIIRKSEGVTVTSDSSSFPYMTSPKLTVSGYYADPDLGCQGYHICLNQGSGARRVSFLCPNGTVFNQAILTCEWW